MKQLEGKYTEQNGAVGRNLTVGNRLMVQGAATVSHNLRVKGFLEAPNIKDPCKGFFANEDELAVAYPLPEDGWWTMVTCGEDGDKVEVWRAWQGKWHYTRIHNDMINIKVDCKQYEEDVENLKDRVGDAEYAIGEHQKALAEHGERLEALEQRVTRAEDTLGGHTGQIEDLRLRYNEVALQVSGLEGTVDGLEGTVTEHGAALGSLQQRCAGLDERVNGEIPEQLSDLALELSDVQGVVDGLEPRMSEVESRAEVATIGPAVVNVNSLLGTEAVMSFAEARAGVPKRLRRPGMRLTFLSSEVSDGVELRRWVTKQWVYTSYRDGGQWDDESYWIESVGGTAEGVADVEVSEAAAKVFGGR